MLRLAAIFIGAALLTACASTANVPTVINTRYIAGVQRDLKAQVGEYSAAVRYYRAHPDADPAIGHQPKPDCGDGEIDFDITNIKVDLATTTDDTAKANGSVSLPIYSLTPTGAVSHEVTNVQDLVYVQWPVPPTDIDKDNAPPAIDDMRPIAKMLITLRNGLIDGARTGKSGAPSQCFRDFDLAKVGDTPHSYKMGVTVVNDAQAGVTLKSAIFSLGASAESKNTDANTITVSFKQAYLPDVDKTPTIIDCADAKHAGKTCIKTKDGEFVFDKPKAGVAVTGAQ